MSDDIEELAKDYRGIEAPPALATRIRAAVADRPVRNHGWMPAAATAVVAAALVGILPALWQTSAVDDEKPVRPSLSALASLKVERPAVSTPRLSQIRTPSAPAMPKKPRLPSGKEQTNIELRVFEEKDHAHS